MEDKELLNAEQKQEQLRRLMLYRVLTSNIITSRMTYGNTTTFGGLRDVYEALGYPGLDGIKFSDYYFRYRRQDLAGKIVEKPVEASWRRLPVVHGMKDTNDAFRDAWEKLEKEKKIYNNLIRADKLTGIGRYGVLLLGFDDSDDLSQPLGKARNLLYLQPFHEDNAPIKTYEKNVRSPRFGLPLTYGIRIAATPGTAAVLETEVHHSRVIHIAEGLLESNIYGTPRLERVYNRLLNMELIVGGSAEMFWQGAFPGLAFKADSETDMTQVATVLEEEIKKYVHNLERYMKLQGLDVQSLAPVVADPTAHVDVQLKMISIASGIPKRILEGSERGELASSQDTEAWDDLMDFRRTTYNEPVILRPVINVLIQVGILPQPENGEYTVEWPDLSAPSDKTKAETGRIRAEALNKYLTSPDALLAMPLQSFLAEIMELPTDKVERIMLEVDTMIKRGIKDDGAGDDKVVDDLNQEETPVN